MRGHEGAAGRDLPVRRPAAEGELDRTGHLEAGVSAHLALDPQREPIRLIEQEVAVHHVERLERRRAARPLWLHLAGVGAVEGAEEAVELGARLALVDHATEVVVGEHRLRGVDLHVVRVRLEEVEAGAPPRRVEAAADGEDGVAKRLGLEAAWRIPPEESGARVGGEAVRPRGARLSVGAARHDEPVQPLQPPPVGGARRIDQLTGQPVEELGMTRSTTVDAEVARRVHEARAEVVVPEPIHDHAGRERVRRRGDPGGNRPAPVALRGVGREPPRRAELRQAARRDLLAGLQWIAAKKPVGAIGRDESAHVRGRDRRQGLQPRFEIQDDLGELLGLGRILGGDA